MKLKNQDLEKVKKYLRSNDSVILDLYQIDNFNDYPPYYQYSAIYKDNKKKNMFFANNGLAFDKDVAQVKTVMESIERWFLSQEVTKTNTHFFQIKHNTIYTKLNSDFIHHLQEKGSVGGAASFQEEEGLYKGICELVERDAFSFYYFNKLTPRTISPVFNKSLYAFVKHIESFHFKIHLLNLKTDIPLFTCLCLLEDVSGIKPYFTLGLRTDVDPAIAIEESILESLQSLHTLRSIAYGFLSTKQYNPILKRLIWWIDKKPHKYLSFLLEGKPMLLTKQPRPYTAQEKLQHALRALVQVGLAEVWWKKVYTHSEIIVTKVYIPGIIPLPLDGSLPNQNARFISLQQMFEIKKGSNMLHTFIHPFP